MPPGSSIPRPLRALTRQAATARKEAAEFKEGWLRERADFNNYKKRVEGQMKDLRVSREISSIEYQVGEVPCSARDDSVGTLAKLKYERVSLHSRRRAHGF